jgi:hypothetical protein
VRLRNANASENFVEPDKDVSIGAAARDATSSILTD